MQGIIKAERGEDDVENSLVSIGIDNKKNFTPVCASVSEILDREQEEEILLMQQLDGGLTPTEGFSKKGHFSKCRIYRKHIIKSFNDERLSTRELNDLYSGFLKYREGLLSLGISIPQSIHSQKYEDTKSILFIDEKISDGIHIDFEDKLLQLKEMDMMMKNFDAVIESLVSFGSQPANNMPMRSGFLRYGVDFKPANIAFDAQNRLYLLDLFVPKVRGSDNEILYVKTIHALSRDVLEYIHFHKAGILYWFYYKTRELLLKYDKNLFLIPILKDKIAQVLIGIYGSNSSVYVDNLDTNYRELPESFLQGLKQSK